MPRALCKSSGETFSYERGTPASLDEGTVDLIAGCASEMAPLLQQGTRERVRVLYMQPAGLNPLDHRDDWVDRPRAMGV